MKAGNLAHLNATFVRRLSMVAFLATLVAAFSLSQARAQQAPAVAALQPLPAPLPVELLQQHVSPVKGDAGAADEPPSPSAFSPAPKMAAAATPAPQPLQSRASRPNTRTVWMEVTAYCPCDKCCGHYADGVTASGKPVSHNRSRFVAADTRLLPFHTKLVIPGYDNERPVPVLDRGGAIKGNKLDVFFPTHRQALKWGRQKLRVTVIED